MSDPMREEQVKEEAAAEKQTESETKRDEEPLLSFLSSLPSFSTDPKLIDAQEHIQADKFDTDSWKVFWGFWPNDSLISILR